jgi:predicted nucleic acid-binding Zn ribbon protein
MPRKGRLTLIASDLHEVVRRTAPKAKGVPAEIYPAWDAVTGSAVAKVTRPDAFHQGVLTVVAKNAVWIQELIMLREQLLVGLEAHLGEPLVRDIRFRVGRLHDRRPPRELKGGPPSPKRTLSPTAERRLAEDVHDPALRAAIAKALSRTRE